MKKISVIIFDCDGVMFDSRQANINFYNHLLQHFGLPLMREDQVTFVHMHTAEKSIRHIFRNTPYMEMAQAYRMRMEYTPFLKDMILEPELKPLLEDLRPRFGLAVATNRSNTIGAVLDLYGLSKYFDIVISSLDVKRPKPHPESLFKILKFFEVDPEEALYVGDSLVDNKTARAAGVPFMSYKNTELDADYHSDRLMDIALIVNSANKTPLSG
jgi:HAD superfamily hydrolase (TIGR01509 family)